MAMVPFLYRFGVPKWYRKQEDSTHFWAFLSTFSDAIRLRRFFVVFGKLRVRKLNRNIEKSQPTASCKTWNADVQADSKAVPNV